MSFDTKIYFEYLNKRDMKNACKYLIDNTPDYLYKFYSLSGNQNNELDVKKLNTLASNSNWYDLPKNQNDPYDMKLAYVDEKLAKEKGAIPEAVEVAKTLLSSLQNSFALCSFIDTDINNLPMWAFYSNNHKGYCVKYKINKKELVQRIYYESARIKIFGTLLCLYEEMKKSEKNGAETKDIEFYRHLVFGILNCKHVSWKAENEFRIIVPTEKACGINISNDIVGIVPEEVYIGINCSADNEKRIIDICKHNLKCKAYKCSTNGNEFLVCEEII